MKHTIRRTFTVRASPDEVFALLTDARKIRTWSGQKGKVQPAIGGRFSLFDGWVKGVVLAYHPGKRLTVTWLPDDWEAGTEPSIVTYTFSGKGNSTKISLLHKNLPTRSIAMSHHGGWDEYVFTPLKTYLEAEQR